MIKRFLLVQVLIVVAHAQSTTINSTTIATTSSNALPTLSESSTTTLSTTTQTTSQITTTQAASTGASTSTTLAAATSTTSTSSAKPTEDTYSSNRVQCSGVTYRKEVRQMRAEGQFDLFVNAFKALAADGTLDKFTQWHGPQGYWSYSHFSPRFLPWHRIYLKEFEKALQAKGCPYLPYWDWSLDSQNPGSSPILGPDYCGSPSADFTRVVYNSEFSYEKYTCPTDGKPLVRDYDPQGTLGAFYHPALLESILNKPSFSSYSIEIEYGPHANIHSVLGGSKGEFSTWKSPNDPIFWLHHCFIDKLWWTFQTRGHTYDFDGRGYSVDIDYDHPIQPWYIPVKNILKCEDVCVAYVDPSPEVVKSCPPLTGPIRAPDYAEHWFNKTGADIKVATQVSSQADTVAVQVNDDISQGKPVPTVIYGANGAGSSDATSMKKHTFGIAAAFTAVFMMLTL